MTSFRLTRRAAIGALGMAGVSGCVPSPPANPRQLVISVAADITTLDAATTFTLQNLIAPNLCYERLLRLRAEDGQTVGVEGDLAEAWELSRDKSSMTFHLQPGHHYDDGTEVHARDFIVSIERVLTQRFPAAQALFWYGGAEAPDARTLHLRLRAYAPYVPYLLTASGLGFVNPAVQAHAEGDDQGSAWLRRNSAGSGPYRVAHFAPREEVLLEPNPYAARPPAFFQKVRLRTSKDTTVRLIELDKGDVDILEGVGPFQQDWLRTRQEVVVESAPAPIVLFLHLNNERPLFRDRRVREAVSLAIDRDAIIASIFRGQARTIPGVIPAGIPGHDPDLPLPVHDVARARVLLREAGVAAGQTVDLTVVGDGGGPSATQLAIRESLQAIGFDVRIRQISISARAQIFAGDFDMTTQSISFDFPDPWILFTFVYSSQMIGAGNMARYANGRLDELLARADQRDGAERIALYQTAQRMVLEDIPSIPLFQTSWAYARRRDIPAFAYNYSTPMMLPVHRIERV